MTPAPDPQPLLAATLIVRDEAVRLPRLIATLGGVVDRVVVYDTGSTDDTVALARSLGAVAHQGYWDDDFARARNAALELSTARWALIVDGDDTLHCPDPHRLRALLDGDASILTGAPDLSAVDLLAVEVVNLDASGEVIDSLPSPRIARRGAVRWAGRVHEQLETAEPGGTAETGGTGETRRGARVLGLPPELIRIHHHGYGDAGARAAKRERNLRIAQAQVDALVAEGSDDPERLSVAAYELGRALLNAGHTQDGARALRAVGEIVSAGATWAQATGMLAQCLLDDAGDPVRGERAMRLVERLAADPAAPDGYVDWLRGQALGALGRLPEALELLGGIGDLVEPNGRRLSADRVLLARSVFAATGGDLSLAAELWLQATLGFPAPADRVQVLHELWAGRHDELEARLHACGRLDLGPAGRLPG